MSCDISIVIPTSDRVKLLENVLYALNEQTCKSFEVIIVDDGSTDGTKQLVEHFNSLFTLRYIYVDKQQGNGASHSRNIGIDMAAGEIIIFLDSDSLVHKDFVAEHYRFHQAHSNLAVVGIRWNLLPAEIDKELIKKGFTREDMPVDNLDKQNRMFQFFSYNMSQFSVPWWFFSTSNASVRKEALLSAGKFDEQFGKYILYEDTEIAYRLYKNSTKFVINANTECYHLYHEVDLKSKLELSKGNIDYFQKKYPDDKDIALLEVIKEAAPVKNEDHTWLSYIKKAVNGTKYTTNVLKVTNYIIPVKNQWTELKEFLDKTNIREDAELIRAIVLDMGSMDNTDIMIQLYASTFKLLYWPIKCESLQEAFAIGRKKVLSGAIVEVSL